MKLILSRFKLFIAGLLLVFFGGVSTTRAEGGPGCLYVFDWSPNGAYIAFSFATEVGIMVAQTSDTDAPVSVSVSRSLFQFNMVDDWTCVFSWAPDSEHVFAVPSGRRYGILAQVQPYGNWSVFGADPYTGIQSTFYDWAPDGAEIYFGTDRDGDMEIYASEINGENRRKLTNNQADDTFVALSPDGSKIFFTSNRDGQYDFYAMDRDGTNIRRLTNNVEGLSVQLPMDTPYFWRWSPDHTHIAFGWGVDNDDYYVMNADGSDLRFIPQGWLSPDWSQIAKLRSVGGITLTDLDGSNSRTLSDLRVNEVYWLPGGRQLVLTVGAEDIAEAIFVINDDGTNLRQIADNGSFLRLSPVGAYLAFERGGEDGGIDILVLDIESGNLVNLTQDWELDYYDLEAWSPDGETLLIRRGEGSYIVVSRDGTNPVDLTRLANCPDATSSYYGAWDWSPDGSQLAYTVRCEQGASFHVMVVTSDGSNPRPLVEIRNRD